MQVLEGVWEEIAARANEFRGKRVRLPAGIPAAHFDTVAERLSDAEVDALLQAIKEG